MGSDTRVSMMRRAWAAVAVGLVLVMTGCGAAVPEGDALYRDGEKRFMELATRMHTVLMGIHEGVWTIPVGGDGAVPGSCTIGFGGADGYAFSYRRTVDLPGMDPEAVSAAAVAAFREAGFDGTPTTYGSGESAEWNVIADDETLGNVVATIRPREGRVEVSADTPCVPGKAGDLSYMVTDDEHRGDGPSTWRYLPATEGPDSVPQFYFPADGPIYFNEDETPVEPQPVVTDPPKAPYGG